LLESEHACSASSFGVIALVRTGRTRQRGRGLAIAGFAVTGGYIIAIVAIVVIMVAVTDPIRDSTGEVVRSGAVPVADLTVGHCISDIDGRTVLTAPVIPAVRNSLAAYRPADRLVRVGVQVWTERPSCTAHPPVGAGGCRCARVFHLDDGGSDGP
jgi:hypothetical protein